MSTRAYLLIESQKDLEHFYLENQSVPWLCFDTEFVGEKRFLTLLCLIQIATEKGNYLVDPFVVKDLRPFLKLIEDPNIIKVTHAGDNDYRLLNMHYGIVPRNVFDTQIAAAFVGYKFPVSFKKLVENELRISLSKGYAVTDWEARPFNNQQLSYALDDVLHLYNLWQMLEEKISHHKRSSWVKEECARWEQESFYTKDPHQEALNSGMMKALSPREQVFLLRLFAWRRELAEKKNYSKEMILSSKLFGHIVKTISSGKDALRQNRRLPDKLVEQHGSVFEHMYREPATAEEKAVLSGVTAEEMESPEEEILLEMLNLLVKFKCLESGVPAPMVLTRGALTKIKGDEEAIRQHIGGWRRELLGEKFLEWLANFDRLDLSVDDGRIEMFVK